MTFQTNFKIDDLMIGKKKEIGWTKKNIRIEADKKPKYYDYCQERADEILRERVRAMDEHEKAVVYEELTRIMQTGIHYG